MLANIDCLGAALSLYGCTDSFLVFCCSLAAVLCLLPVVDALEDGSTLPCALCDGREALGKSLVLETLKSFFWSRERLLVGWGNEVGWGEGTSS